MNDPTLLRRFEQLKIPAAEFRHKDHLQVAFEMLDEYDFIEACSRYASTIRALAESVGALDKFNMTVTIAFLSLIAERKTRLPRADFDAFLEANPELLDREVLSAWYSSERLDCKVARGQFLLPDKIAV